MRLAAYLTDQHVPFETVLHPPAFTAQKRAHCLHVPGRQLAKCVLLAGPDGYVLAVLPATHRVDLEAVSRVLGQPMRLANAEEMAACFCDCEWGTLAPFGALWGIPTIADDALDPAAEIVFEAQSHAMAIRMRCCDFERLERPRRFPFSRQVLGREQSRN